MFRILSIENRYTIQRIKDKICTNLFSCTNSETSTEYKKWNIIDDFIKSRTVNRISPPITMLTPADTIELLIMLI